MSCNCRRCRYQDFYLAAKDAEHYVQFRRRFWRDVWYCKCGETGVGFLPGMRHAADASV